MTNETIATAATSKRDAIINYRKANPGVSVKQIAETLNSNLQYVYTVLKEQQIGKKVKRKVGRPRKEVSSLTPPPVKHDPEIDRMRSAVSEHARIVDGLKKEIGELTVIIAYLEHRCFKAEGARGPSV